MTTSGTARAEARRRYLTRGSPGRRVLVGLAALVCLFLLLFVSDRVSAQSVFFALANTFPAGTGPADIVLADFNKDGIPDLAVTNFDPSTRPDTVTVFLGEGGGKFGPPSSFPVRNLPVRLAAGDINKDGNLDLVVSNFGTSRDSPDVLSILLGDGDGNFTPWATIPVVGADPRGVAIGDVDNDGNPDLVVALSGSGVVEVFLGDGAGGFSFPIILLGFDGNPFDLALADLNGDGNLDIVTTTVHTGNPTDHISVLLGHGDGTFGIPATFPVGVFPASLAIADLNGDGALDVAATNNDERSSSVSILLGNGRGGFAPARDFFVGLGPHGVVIADLNGDGKLDLAIVQDITDHLGIPHGRVAVLLGDGAGAFGAPLSFATGSESSAVVAADFNGDERIDLAVANFGGDTVVILLNTPLLSVLIDIKPHSFPNSINLGSHGTVPVAVLSSATFDARTVDPATVTLAGAPVKRKKNGTLMASFEDVNGDGLLDLVLHVPTQELQLQPGNVVGILEGETFSGQHLRGSDSVRIVPPPQAHKR